MIQNWEEGRESKMRSNRLLRSCKPLSYSTLQVHIRQILLDALIVQVSRHRFQIHEWLLNKKIFGRKIHRRQQKWFCDFTKRNACANVSFGKRTDTSSTYRKRDIFIIAFFFQLETSLNILLSQRQIVAEGREILHIPPKKRVCPSTSVQIHLSKTWHRPDCSPGLCLPKTCRQFQFSLSEAGLPPPLRQSRRFEGHFRFRGHDYGGDCGGAFRDPCPLICSCFHRLLGERCPRGRCEDSTPSACCRGTLWRDVPPQPSEENWILKNWKPKKFFIAHFYNSPEMYSSHFYDITA